MEALLLIDPQNDFCNSEKGALGVPGAEEDCKRIKDELMDPEKIDDVYVTMDTHYPYDISHPLFWVDSKGNHPDPLTPIPYEDVNKKWFPVDPDYKKWVEEYVSFVEIHTKYDHLIWPTHCIHGSWGHMIHPTIMEGLIEWSNKKAKNFNVIEKGENPFTEHFGAFSAVYPLNSDGKNIEEFDVDDDGGTIFNRFLESNLQRYDKIHLAGEAESHCVAFTLDQINNMNGYMYGLTDRNINDRLVIHKNCMSPVPGFEGSADDIFDAAKEKGSEIVE